MSKQKQISYRYRLCPKCGNFAHFSLEQFYCVVCGTKMIEECPRCKEPIIYPTSKFCPICGESYLDGIVRNYGNSNPSITY